MGKIPKCDADSIASKVEHLVSRKVQGSEPDPNVAEWVSKLPEKLHRKLVRFGLVTRREKNQAVMTPGETAPMIKQWTERYINGHIAKEGMIKQLEVTARGLCRFFGNNRRIDTLTRGDAEDFRKWMEKSGNERNQYTSELAKNTVRRRIGRCKQISRYVVQHRFIDSNPFSGEAATVTGNHARMVMVPHEWIEQYIKASHNEAMRIALAFARYAGMRKHKTLMQRWADIDLQNNRMLVRSRKTPTERVCPIFAELRPHLLRARRMAGEDHEFVQTLYRPEQNLVPAPNKIVKRVGLELWGKPMQNLRASRETELLARYP